MLEATFRRLCKIKRLQGGVGEVDTSKNITVFKKRKKLDVCACCRGKRLPAGLEFIKLHEMEGKEVGTKKFRGKCEGGCGQGAVLVSLNYGVNMCSTCSTIYSHVLNRSETVIAAIKRLDRVDHYVGQLAGEVKKVTVEVESDVLQRIAEAVGFGSSDGESLVKAIRAKMQELAAADGALDQETEVVHVLEGKVESIRQALGVTDPSYDLNAAIKELAQALDKYRVQCESLAERLNEKEKAERFMDENLEQIRSALEQPLLPVGEIAMHCKALRDSVGFCPPTSDTLEPYASVLSAERDYQSQALIDFALRVIEGRVTLVHHQDEEVEA
jgi:hypothetical protein